MALQEHFAVPQTGYVVVNLASLFVLDRTANGIVRAREVALGLELQIGHKVVFGASDKAVVAELVLHFSEQNSAGVHIRLRQNAGKCQMVFFFFIVVKKTYYRSPLAGSVPRFKKRKIAVPSIRLAAELPRNLLRGLSVPSILMWCSGAMKK